MVSNGTKEEPRVGVYVCHCGVNIAGKVDVSQITEFAGKLPNVVVSREYKFMCSDPGQELIANDIRELDLNRVVVASCSPCSTSTLSALLSRLAAGDAFVTLLTVIKDAVIHR